MPLDSLGLGLTLDTTLLEKADKTLENMHKNSKLIMQNLTRGFTSFNSGGADAFTKMSTALGHVSDALTKIDNAEVSPDFDTKGQEKFIDRMQKILSMVEKMSKIKDAKFYDPTEVYVTDKDATDIFGEMQALQEHKKKLAELVEITKNYDHIQRELKKTMYTLRGEIPAQKKEVDSLANAYNEAKKKQEAALKAMATQFKAFSTRERKKDSSLTDEQLLGMFASKDSMRKYVEEVTKANEELVKAEEKLVESKEKLEQKQSSLREAGKEYQSNWRVKQQEEEIKLSYENIKEREKILQKELEFSQATEAERAAMLTKKNEAEIKADQKRIRDVQKSYENLRKEIQKGEKDIADLEKSREKLKAAGGKTKEIDDEIAALKKAQDEKLDAEIEFRTSKYWPQLEEIDKKYSTKAFKEEQKRKAKEAEKASRKDVTAALQYSRNAQTINEEKEAIKRLVEARDNLSTSTARYKKTVEDINKRILAHKDHIEAVTRVEKEQNTLADSVINRYRKQLKALDEVNEALEKQMKIERKTSVADLDPNNADTQALLARQKTITDDIKAIEKSAQGELDIIREQHDAERAKKRIDETLRQNEREKQEYAKLLDDLYALEKQKKAMEEAGGGVGDAAYDKLIQQENDLNARKSQLEAKHQRDLDEIRKKHDKKRNDDEVKAFIDAQKERLRVAEETQKKIDAYNEKYGTVSKRGAEIAIESYKGAQNIAQHKRAIENLQKVRAKLDNTDSQYFLTLKKIDKALKEHHKALRDAGVESNNLMQTHRGLMNIGGQLARRLALAFSVSQLTQYFRKLVEVRGQFEKTEVALTSIIGDNQKAQKLMNQTIALAIQSPFTLQQLTGYTKQLAAYQVSYEELHSTTKMLADVSAGLGVEMDRLILAFGQVKAANYLRATEVRQFTEAGFNILGELAEYYSELEGRMISVGDVQERVTKRMVDFADVEEIFHRVTEAGGMFFDMQSKQAETLAGQWTNLQDRIDIMLNEIGSDKEGLLKGIVGMLASLIDNWEALADVIKVVVGAFVLYKVNLLSVTKAQVANSIAAKALIKDEIRMLGVTKGLASAWKDLGFSVNFTNGAMKKFFVANAWLLALTAIAAVISSVISHFNKLNDAVDENTKAFSENRSEAKKLAEEYGELNAALAETVDREKALAIIEKKRLKLQELAVKLKERGLKLTNEEGEVVDIEKVDAALLDDLFDYNQTILDNAYTLGEELGEAITRGANAAQGTVLGFSFFGENLQEDAEDLGETYGKIASHTFDAYMKSVEANIHNNLGDLSERSQKLYAELAEGRKAERNDAGEVTKWLESEYDWTKRRLKLLQEIAFQDKKILGVQLKLNNARANLANAESEFSHELDGVLNKLIEKYGSVEELKKAYEKNPQVISAAIKTEVDKTSWNENVKWFAEQELHAKLTIDYNYVEVVSTTPPQKVYEGFKKDLIDARKNLEGKGEGYSNFFISTGDIDKMEQFTDGLKGLQKAYDDNIKKRESLKDTTTEEGKAELLMVNAIIAEVERLASAWGYTLETKKDEKLERLKNQISLVKEMNKEYEKLNKTYSKTESLEKVKKAYEDTAKELKLDISKMDFTDKGTIETLKKLLGDPKYSANKYALELKKALDGFKAEVDLEADEQKTRELVDQVQEIFDDYELAVDIKKLNIPSELAKNLFGVDTKSFDQMRTEIISKFAGTNEEVSKILSKGSIISAEDEKILIEAIGKERVDEAKKAIKKIDNLEEKQQLESAKRFVKFLTKNLDQTKVIMSQRGIDIAFAKEQFDKGRISAKQFAETVKNIVAQSNEEIRKFNLDKFKESAEYIQAMGDLSSYSKKEIQGLIKTLNDAVTQNAHLFDADEVKAYMDALKKAQEELESRDVFKWGDFERAADIIQTQKEIEDKKVDIADNKETLETQKEKLKELEEELKRLKTQKETESKAGKDTKDTEGKIEKKTQEIVEANEGIEQTNSKIKTNTGLLSLLGDKMKGLAGNMDTTLAIIDAIVHGINDTVQGINTIYGEIGSVMESFGKETDFSTEFGKGAMLMDTFAKSSQAAADGWDAFKNGDPVGVIVNVVKSITEIIKGINAYHDAGLEVIIQDHLEEVERLQKEYEKLEWVIDRAFSFDKYGKVAEQTKNLGKQIENTSKAIALEEDKKDTDEERIKELRENAEEARRQIHELYDNLRQEIVGSYEDLSSTLADAMIEALKNGEDALKAWGDEVDNIIANIVTKLAVQKYVEPQVSRVLDQFYNKVMPKNAAAEKAFTRLQSLTVGTKEYEDALAEWERLNSQAIGELPQLTESSVNALKNSLNAIGVSFEPIAEQIAGIFGGQGDGLSALQKGIQGITEDTAQIIEAYLNSIRGYVSEQVTHTKNIYNILYDAVRHENHAIWVKLAGQ